MAAEGVKWDGWNKEFRKLMPIRFIASSIIRDTFWCDATTLAHDQLRISQELSCYWEKTCFLVWRHSIANGATFEFSSTGWYKVRDTPIKRCLTWGRTKYGSTTCSTATACSMHGTTASLMTTSEIVFRLIGIKTSQVNKFTIIGINFEHRYHVKKYSR